MQKFLITKNGWLSISTLAFFHTDYTGFRQEGNPDYINTLKNIYNSAPSFLLSEAALELEEVLDEDLNKISHELRAKFPNEKFTVCVVPRSKTNFTNNQLLFKQTVSKALSKQSFYTSGVDYIQRTSDTRTTHMKNPTANFINSGESPYPGIALDTCTFSSEIEGKNILLIDDIYTKTINIDEDFIEALYKKGAKNVVFYAIGKTFFNGYR